MTQSLAQLQAEWHESENDPDGPTGAVFGQCADALQPHVEREAAAQAKSLADERRIQELEAALRTALMFVDGYSQHDGRDAVHGCTPCIEMNKARAALRVETK